MKAYIESLGCDSNLADTNRIKKYFEINGAKIIQDYKKADIIILMSCGFNKIMMNKNIKRLKSLAKTNAKILLGGCMPKINKNIINLADYSFGPRELNKLDKIFNFKIKINQISPEFNRNGKKIIRISTGCEQKCSYCAIKIANENTKSRKIKEIKQDIKQGLKQGFSRFVFTSEDNGSWGQDLDSNLIELVKHTIKIRGDFIITLTTINPVWFIRYPKLFNLFKLKKIEKKIYLPLQSGSDRILKLMNRKYNVEEYKSIFHRLKKIAPDIKIETDILIGFPTEKQKDFLETLKIIKELGIYFLQVFVYTDMERTISNIIIPKVPFAIAKKRAKKLIHEFLKKNKCAHRILVNTNLEPQHF